MALGALLTNNSELAKEAYAKATLAPRTQTSVDLMQIGYVMNGTLHGSVEESLHICFDGTAPKVVKVIDEDEMMRTQSFLDAAVNDLPIGAQIPDHTNHVITFSLYRVHGKCLTIMPLLPATLEHIKRLCVGDAQKLLRQMIMALSFIHDHGFAHMDVKPSNICINGEGDFILADLGSMALFGKHTKSTTPYVPKDLQIPRMVSAIKTDFWMLAMTLGERLCGLDRGTATPEPSRAELIVQLNAHEGARTIIGDLIARLELET